MFGISTVEFIVIVIVALVVLGPERLPSALRTGGRWIRKAREVTSQVRQQAGIDEMLRAEGVQGGLNELRDLVRGLPRDLDRRPPGLVNAPYDLLEIDGSREYPVDGPDSYGALPDDLVPKPSLPASATPTVEPGAEGPSTLPPPFSAGRSTTLAVEPDAVEQEEASGEARGATERPSAIRPIPRERPMARAVKEASLEQPTASRPHVASEALENEAGHLG